MTVVVFLGPSLPLDEARRVLPDAVYEPPVTQGDLISAVLHHGARAVGMIDGRFDQVLSVWHREVLWALEHGVRVVGGGSMGALRAAECDVFGMEGVGTIYGWYRDGVITGDDEVAVVHAEADEGWRSFSLPMVNLRATVAAALEAGAVRASEAERLLEAGRGLWYPHRTERSVVEAAGLSRDVVETLRAHAVDLKARDARAVLASLAEPVAEPRSPSTVSPPSSSARLGRALRHLDRWVERRAGRVRLDEVVHQVLATRPDAERLHRAAALRSVAVTEGERLGIEPGPGDLAEATKRLRRRCELVDGEAERAWRVANDVDDAEFARMVREEAVIVALQRFVVRSDPFLRGRHHLLDELRLAGLYPALADAAARQRAGLATSAAVDMPDDHEQLDEIVRAWARRANPPRGPELTGWLEDLGYLDGVEAAFVLAEHHAWERRRADVLRSLSGIGAVTKQRPVGEPPPAPGVLRVLESFRPALAAIALVRHGILDRLHEQEWRPLPADRIDRALVAAANSLGFVDLDETTGRVRLTASGAILTRSAPDSLAPWAEELGASHLPAWTRLAGAGSGAEIGSADLYRHLAGDDKARGRFDDALEAMTGVALPELRWPIGLDWTGIDSVVDLGGGVGVLLAQILDHASDLTGWLVDRPEVLSAAQQRLHAAGVGDRAIVLDAGAPLPPADRYLACRFFMNLADDEMSVWLGRVAGVMPPHGELVVIEPVAGRSTGWAFADLNNLLLTGGAVRSLDQWRAIAARAGLSVTAESALSPALHELVLGHSAGSRHDQ